MKADVSETEGFWQATLDSLPDAVAVLAQTGDIVAVNQVWRTFALDNDGPTHHIGVNYLAVCDRSAADDPIAAEVARALRELLDGTREVYECLYPCHAPWQRRWFSVRMTPLQHHGGRRVVVSHRDITEAHEEQRRSEERAELLDAVGAAVIATDLDGHITYWSDGAATLYGWLAHEVRGRHLAAVTCPPDQRESTEVMLRQLLDHAQWEGRRDALHRNGSTISTILRTRLLHDTEGLPTGFVAVSLDVTEEARLQQQLRSTSDVLDVITHTMPDGLCVIDAHGCAMQVNEAAEAMLGWASGADLPSQIFAITTAAAGTAVRVDDAVFPRRDGGELAVSYSATPFTSEAGEQHWVLVFQDITARKAAERRTREQLEQFSWIGRIRHALDQDRFVLYAQPIVDLATGETVQHELLIRMLDEDGGVIPPGAFLPVAEEHGLIREIDRYVFERAFAFAADGHPVEVNVSADSLGDAGLSAHVAGRLAALGVDPALIVFEITETALIDNEGEARAFVQSVRELGCAVALDDFGTGYGSFRYLKHLPVSVLKIDREFVRDLDGPDLETNRHVITAIVSLARGMGQKTVAEGVETATALAVLRELGVDFAQGYHLGRPAPAETVLVHG